MSDLRGPFLLDLSEKEELKQAYRNIGCDSAGIRIMLDKAKIYPLLLKEVKTPAANILKQHMLSLGGEAVVARWTVCNEKPLGDVLLLGTIKEYSMLCEKLISQPWGLRDLSRKISEIIPEISGKHLLTWQWKDGKSLEIGAVTRIMGILNVTPDSFSDGGKYLEPERALEKAWAMVEGGADIIDVGAESTRPNIQPISAEEEINRLMPVLERLIKEMPVPISLDTYKAEVAQEGLKLGIHILNDQGGGLRDAAMSETAAIYQCPVIAMHNPVKNSADSFPYTDVVADVTESLAASRDAYKAAGLAPDKIILDPGIGFGKSLEQNLQVIRNISVLKGLGCPILLAVSRKGFIGKILDTETDQRLEGSLAVAAWAVTQGVGLLRVHDVKETVRLVRMLEAIRKIGGAHEEQ